MIIVPTEKRFDWKHTPIVLICIVAANILIFFLYQSSDNQKIDAAMRMYQEQALLKTEWPLFTQYLQEIGDPSLAEYEKAYSEGEFDFIAYSIIAREDFYNYLKADAFELIGYFDIDEWAKPRAEIHEQIMSVSYLAYGLISTKVSAVDLVTHQFLHGDLMHLLGNMFFLIICGFAVEAAIGHLRFLVFYLLSGIVGGLAHAVFEGATHSTLVGASGAISGVMAMYLGIFRFKKIEFFYWFFVFVGYVRIPALFILPFYIGKELYSYYGDEASNVAFMAHAGGFVAGALLILGLLAIKRDSVNDEYIEEDQSLDTDRQGLADIHRLIENYKFVQAIKEIERFVKENGARFDLLLLRFKLCRLLNEKASVQAFEKLSMFPCANAKEASQLYRTWAENKNLENSLGLSGKLALATTLVNHHITDGVDKLIHELTLTNEFALPVSKLASKLAVIHQERGEKAKSARFRQVAQDLDPVNL